MKITIAGAGIGGLATALALADAGHDVRGCCQSNANQSPAALDTPYPIQPEDRAILEEQRRGLI